MPSQALKGVSTQEIFDLLQYDDDQREALDDIKNGKT
jgi:hypothetical protein